MGKKIFKLVLVCLLCLAIVYGVVWIVQHFFTN